MMAISPSGHRRYCSQKTPTGQKYFFSKLDSFTKTKKTLKMVDRLTFNVERGNYWLFNRRLLAF